MYFLLKMGIIQPALLVYYIEGKYTVHNLECNFMASPLSNSHTRDSGSGVQEYG